MSGSIHQDEADLAKFAPEVGATLWNAITNPRGPHTGFDKIKAGLDRHDEGILNKDVLSVVLMRGEPVHKGHEDLINKALAYGEQTLILLGSAYASRSLDNPFTYAERKALLECIYAKEIAAGLLTIKPLRDMKYQDAKWKSYALATINLNLPKGFTPVFVTMEKDPETAWTISFFEGSMGVVRVKQDRVINATDLRAELFAGTAIDDVYFGPDDVSPCVVEFLKKFKETKDFHRLVLENEAVRKQQRINKEITAINGFPPIYVACDLLAIWYDHWKKPNLLLITRKGEIGNGKFAMVGGYVNHDETVLTAVKREAGPGEEASLDLSQFYIHPPVMFDDPKRSKRGRMITHVYKAEIYADVPPQIKAGDDAATVQWVPLDQIAGLQENFFADHYHIISKMLPEVDLFHVDA